MHVLLYFFFGPSDKHFLYVEKQLTLTLFSFVCVYMCFNVLLSIKFSPQTRLSSIVLYSFQNFPLLMLLMTVVSVFSKWLVGNTQTKQTAAGPKTQSKGKYSTVCITLTPQPQCNGCSGCKLLCFSVNIQGYNYQLNLSCM